MDVSWLSFDWLGGDTVKIVGTAIIVGVVVIAAAFAIFRFISHLDIFEL